MPTSIKPTLDIVGPEDIRPGVVWIYRLPAELWLQIFVLGKRYDDTYLFASAAQQITNTDSVSAVSQTCTYFRELALQSPTLWTSIHIRNTYRKSCIQRRMERSLPLTLDIEIYLTDEGNPNNISNMEAAMVILMGEIDRWRSLRIRLSTEEVARPVVMGLRDRGAPNLEFLSLSVNGEEHSHDIFPSSYILNHGTPALVSTKLRGVAHLWFRPPLANLTTLRLEGKVGRQRMDFTDFVKLLTEPKHLRHLLIRRDIVNPDVWALQSQGLLRLIALHSLHIYSESGAMYAGFLLAINAPKLSALTLEGVFDHDLDHLWTRAAPHKFLNLTQLTLVTEGDLSTTTYVKAGRLFPNITGYSNQRLTPPSSELLKLLVRGILQQNGQPLLLWPKLQKLCLRLEPSAESMELVQQVVGNRVCVGCPHLQVCFFPSDSYGWAPVHGWSIHLRNSVQLLGYNEVLPTDSIYIDINDAEI